MTITLPTSFRVTETSPSASAIGSPSRTHLDLFTGIGGFTIAAQAAGYKTIGFSETNPYDCKLLKELWPDVPNHGDIRNVRNIRADLVTGGFPCQPYSTAGKRAGASDDRALWPEMCRVIAESKPRWVLGENVAGIISMELDRVLDDLESLGYAAWPIVIPACAVDARHRRMRVWIMGNADGLRPCSAENGQGNPSGKNGDTKRPHELCEPARPSGARKENVADASRELPHRGGVARNGCGQSSNGCEDVSDADGRQHESGGAQSNQRPMAEADGGSDGRPYDWMPEPGMGRVAHGIPHRSHRLKALGNAIVPQVATVILKMMARMENVELKHGAKNQ